MGLSQLEEDLTDGAFYSRGSLKSGSSQRVLNRLGRSRVCRQCGRAKRKMTKVSFKDTDG